MIQLIKNELIKLFKKKSTYLILLLFLVLVIGVTYKYSKQIEKDPDAGYFLYEEEYINYSDTNKSQIFESTISNDKYSKHTIEELVNKYGYNSWQVDSFLINYDTIINSVGINKEDYKDIEKTFDKDDWREFTKVLIQKLEKIDTKGNKDLKSGIICQITKLNSRLENNIIYGYDFLNDAVEIYYDNEASVERKSNFNSYFDETTMQRNEKGMKFAKYIIENKKDVLNYRNARANLIMFFEFFDILIVIVLILFSSTIINNEFKNGTIRHILISKYGRGKIWLSKIITLMIMLILVIILGAFATTITGGIVFKETGFDIPALMYNFNNGTIYASNCFIIFLIKFLMKLPLYLVIIALSVFISNIILNPAISIVITVVTTIFGNTLNNIAVENQLDFLKYVVSVDLEFPEMILGKLPEVCGVDLFSCIIVVTIFLYITITSSYLIFKNKEI